MKRLTKRESIGVCALAAVSVLVTWMAMSVARYNKGDELPEIKVEMVEGCGNQDSIGHQKKKLENRAKKGKREGEKKKSKGREKEKGAPNRSFLDEEIENGKK